MPFVELVAEPRDDVTRELFDTDLAQRGYVPNFTRLFAHRPGVYKAWRALVGEVAGNMDERRYEQSTTFARVAADIETVADRLAALPIEELRPYRAAAE